MSLETVLIIIFCAPIVIGLLERIFSGGSITPIPFTPVEIINHEKERKMEHALENGRFKAILIRIANEVGSRHLKLITEEDRAVMQQAAFPEYIKPKKLFS
ncbi:hypothetical protein [Paenibacillus sp. SER-28]